MEEYQQSTQSKFNSATDILQTVAYLKYKSTEEYRKGNIIEWYYEWKQIRFQIQGRMEDKEYDEFLKLEKKIAYIINQLSKNNKFKQILITLIEAYVRKIQRTIEEWGMGTVNKEDEIHFA